MINQDHILLKPRVSNNIISWIYAHHEIGRHGNHRDLRPTPRLADKIAATQYRRFE
jgi:hypothetical protein